VLSCVDLTQAVPMMLDELDDLVRLVDLAEEWLRFDADARDLLTDWLVSRSSCPRSVPMVWAVIEELGTVGVKLHRLLRAGIPNTGHVHPPTG
jgi:hypothetical protein